MIRKALLFAAVFFGALLTWRHMHAAPREQFQTVQVERRDIVANVVATGSVNAPETVEVGAQVSGTLLAVYVDYNTRVHPGQVLALIDPGPFETQLKEAQANLKSVQAQATAAKSSVEESKIAVEMAQRQSESQQSFVKIAESAEAVAKRTFDHDQALEAANAVTDDAVRTDKTNFELAQDDVQVAQAQANAAELAIDDKQAAVGQAQAQMDAANAQVQQDQAALAQAQVNLTHTQIVSPIEGYVLDRKVSGGETVQSSAVAPVLFELIPDGEGMQVDVDVDESDVSGVKPGQDATFLVDAYPGRTFHGTVRQVRQDATNIQNVISYDVVLKIVKPPVDLFPGPVDLFPGMTANVSIQVATRHSVLAVPNSALRYRPPGAPLTSSGAHVYQVGANGALVAQTVVAGLSDGRYTEIVSGNLKVGDAVVSSSSVVS